MLHGVSRGSLPILINSTLLLLLKQSTRLLEGHILVPYCDLGSSP